jgi:hypothetical protein
MTTPGAGRPPRKRGDIVAAALLAFFLVVLLVVGILRPAGLLNGFNFGFGPEMECTGVGYGDPVCLRKPGSAHR